MKKKKKKIFLRRMRGQLSVVMVLLTFALLFLVGKIIYINVTNGAKYKQRVLSQKRYRSISVPYKRGDILDTNGTILATSNKIYNLVIEPKNILEREANKDATVEALEKYFDITPEEMSEYLKDSNSQYKVIRKDAELIYVGQKQVLS